MKSVLLTFFLSMAIAVSAQTNFQQTISNDLRTNFGEIVQTPDDGFLIAGSFSPMNYDSVGAILVKLNASMDIQWSKRYRYLREDDFATITSLQDGNYLVGGTYRQDFVLSSGGSLTKVDGGGNVIWSKLYDHVSDDRTIAVFEHTDNSIMLFIRYGVSGRGTKIVRANAAGDILEKFILLRDEVELKIDAVASDGNGNYYGMGVVNNDLFQPQIFVVKFNGSSVSWAKEYSLGRLVQYVNGIAVMQDGSVALSGSVVSQDDNNDQNYLMIRLNTSGTVLHSVELDAANSELGTGITGTADNGVLMLGYSGDFAVKGSAFKFSSSGNLEWARFYGGDEDYIRMGRPYELPDGRILMSGSKELYDVHQVISDANGMTPCDAYDANLVSRPHSVSTLNITTTMQTSPVVDIDVTPLVSDYPLDKTIFCDMETVITGVEDYFDSEISLYPVPASRLLHINYGGSAAIDFTIVNSLGKLSGYGTLVPGGERIVDISRLTPGIYIIPEIGKRFSVVH